MRALTRKQLMISHFKTGIHVVTWPLEEFQRYFCCRVEPVRIAIGKRISYNSFGENPFEGYSGLIQERIFGLGVIGLIDSQVIETCRGTRYRGIPVRKKA